MELSYSNKKKTNLKKNHQNHNQIITICPNNDQVKCKIYKRFITKT